MQRPFVPFWVNGIAPPLPLSRRVFAAGQMVRAAVESLPGSARVAVVASGAISGDIGGPHASPGGPGAPPDEAWVTFAVECMRTGNVEDLLNAATRERLQRAGNVTGEVLNWIALLGTVADRRATDRAATARRQCLRRMALGLTDRMSLYGIHKTLWLLQNDLEFRELLRRQPRAALADLPLTEVERRALLDRDMAALYRMGTHTFLMSRLPRFNALGGLTRTEYQASLRQVLHDPDGGVRT